MPWSAVDGAGVEPAVPTRVQIKKLLALPSREGLSHPFPCEPSQRAGLVISHYYKLNNAYKNVGFFYAEPTALTKIYSLMDSYFKQSALT